MPCTRSRPEPDRPPRNHRQLRARRSVPHCESGRVARKRENHRVGAGTAISTSCRGPSSRCCCRSGSWPSLSWSTQKKSLSSYQLARDCELTEPTALYMQHRIRSQMAGEQRDLLQASWKPMRPVWAASLARPGTVGAPRGRGTSRTPVIGAVERGGDMVARVAENTSGRPPRQAPIFAFRFTIRAANHAAHEKPCSPRNHEGNSLHSRIQSSG